MFCVRLNDEKVLLLKLNHINKQFFFENKFNHFKQEYTDLCNSLT